MDFFYSFESWDVSTDGRRANLTLLSRSRWLVEVEAPLMMRFHYLNTRTPPAWLILPVIPRTTFFFLFVFWSHDQKIGVEVQSVGWNSGSKKKKEKSRYYPHALKSATESVNICLFPTVSVLNFFLFFWWEFFLPQLHTFIYWVNVLWCDYTLTPGVCIWKISPMWRDLARA